MTVSWRSLSRCPCCSPFAAWGATPESPSSLLGYETQAPDDVALLGERWRRVDPGRCGVGVPEQVLDVGEVGPRVPKPRRERMANLIHRERFETRLPGRHADRLVRARRGPSAERFARDDARATVTASFTSGTAARQLRLPRGDGDVRDRVLQVQDGAGQASHL